jgi:serine/threonine-protein kinase/endoribonuclease IRE1
MAPLLYLIAFLFALISAGLAEVISLRSAPGRSQALAERAPSEYSFISPSSDASSSTGDLELLDIVLVASVDGKFHALNRTSGQTLWSMSSFPSSTSISAPSTLAPLVRTTHVDHDPDMTDETTPQELYVIEPQSGDIYVMATPTSPLQRFPFSMSELVDMSPFSFSGTDDRRVFVGRKETSLLLIELETGKIKATLNSECAWDQPEEEGDEEVDLDELDGSKPQISTPTEVYIGRTGELTLSLREEKGLITRKDYHISIHTRALSRNPHSKPPVQNLSFSTYGPNNKDSHLQGSYRRTKDDAYIQSLPSGEIISFKARPKGEPLSKDDSLPLWERNFNTAMLVPIRRSPGVL